VAVAYHSMKAAANLDLPVIALLRDVLLLPLLPAWAALWPVIAPVGAMALCMVSCLFACLIAERAINMRQAIVALLSGIVAMVCVVPAGMMVLAFMVTRVRVAVPLALALDASIGAAQMSHVAVSFSLRIYALALVYRLFAAPSASLLASIAVAVPVLLPAAAFVWAVAAAATEVYFAVHASDRAQMELPFAALRAPDAPPWFGAQTLPHHLVL